MLSEVDHWDFEVDAVIATREALTESRDGGVRRSYDLSASFIWGDYELRTG